MPPTRSRTHYEVLGVSPACSFDELRSAYRRMARAHHPDVVGPRDPASALGSMAEVNEAWRVLSDERLRRQYDLAVQIPIAGPAPGSTPPDSRPQPQSRSQGRPAPVPGVRRQAWVAGMQAQIARLSRQAGRSATQTLLIRNPRGSRADYEEVVDRMVGLLIVEAESRVRAARAAGAAPLDLGVAASLVGIRSVSDGLRREATLGVDVEMLMAAELLDRMWDVLAHELPSQLSSALGGNPRVAQALTGR